VEVEAPVVLAVVEVAEEEVAEEVAVAVAEEEVAEEVAVALAACSTEAQPEP